MKFAALKSAAERDLEGAHTYYLNEVGVGVAEKFVEAFAAAIIHLEAFPASGSTRYGELLGTPTFRSWPLRGFPYLLFYIEQDEHLDVVRLLHQNSDIFVHLLNETLN